MHQYATHNTAEDVQLLKDNPSEYIAKYPERVVLDCTPVLGEERTYVPERIAIVVR